MLSYLLSSEQRIDKMNQDGGSFMVGTISCALPKGYQWQGGEGGGRVVLQGGGEGGGRVVLQGGEEGGGRVVLQGGGEAGGGGLEAGDSIVVGTIPLELRKWNQRQGGQGGVLQAARGMSYPSVRSIVVGTVLCELRKWQREQGAIGMRDGHVVLGSIFCELPKRNQSPYEAFKNKMRFRHPGSYWSDTSQKLCPWSEKPKDLPPSDCKLALTCYGGHIVHSRKKEIQRTVGEEDLLELLKPPCSRGAIILHGLVPNHLLPEDRQASCKMRHSKAFLDCLQTIAPDIKMPKGELGPAKEKAYRELNKHLPHLLFLKPNKYWSFCIDAYEKFELGGLMKYIDENIRDNDLAPPELVPPGWKGIRASLLIRLAHQYGPVQEAHGRFSFKFSKNKVGWFFRELFLHLTKEGAAAEPKGSIMIFEEGNKLKAEQYPFDEIILLEDIEY